MKSQAVLFTAKNTVEFGQVEIPEPGPGDVMVRTKYSWISNGTEGSFLRQERVDGITPWSPGMPPPYPMVPGYQKVGLVEAVGAEVKGIQPGQWVFVTITKCLGVQFGFAGHIAIGPAAAGEVYPLPPGVDPVAYSGLVLTQVGYNSGARPPVEGACHALVIGDGMVGNWAAQTLQARGAAVGFVGRHEQRLALFEARAQDVKFNSRGGDWLERAREWAGGEFDIVVDTVGNEANHELNDKLVPMLKWGGHFVAAGHNGTRLTDLKPFIFREATIHCPCGWTRPRLEATLNMIHEGRLKTLPLITDRLPARGAAEAWRRIVEQRDGTLGVVLEWD